MRIALLTDFGTRDPYVAAMKGVLAARADATVHDLTHDIAPFDVWQAAFFLRDVVAYWPAETIFVCVVDPGVGTSRRIIAVRDDAGRMFLAPDNGLLTFINDDAFDVIDESHFLPQGSNTFHGRDRFVPVAAALANGVAIETLGPRIDDRVRLDYEPPAYGCDRVDGTIVSVDRFGNLVTDIDASRIPFPRFALTVGAHEIASVSRTYSDAAAGAFLIVGSTGCVEISVANASAADLLQLSRSLCVTIQPR